MVRRIRKLSTPKIIPLLESQRKLFSETKDDLLDLQMEQLDQCLQLWIVPDSSSRHVAREKARTFLACVYKDKALGADVFLLCALGVSVTKLGTVNSIEAIYEIRKWWREVEHPVGLTATAKEYVLEHHSIFAILEGSKPSRPPQMLELVSGTTQARGLKRAIEAKDDKSRDEQPQINECSSKRPRLDPQIIGDVTWPSEGQYFPFSFTRRDMIDKLPEQIRTGVKNSRLWRAEQKRGGLSVTNCLSLYLPEKHNEDTFSQTLLALVVCSTNPQQTNFSSSSHLSAQDFQQGFLHY